MLHVDHQRLYEKGILHRDASTGNIIINISPDSENSNVKTYGYLIDYDHAKTTDIFEEWPESPHKTSPENLGRIQGWNNVTERAAEMAVAIIGTDRNRVSNYLSEMIRRRLPHLSDKPEISEEDLGWKEVWFIKSV
jgi:hypothetical protein